MDNTDHERKQLIVGGSHVVQEVRNFPYFCNIIGTSISLGCSEGIAKRYQKERSIVKNMEPG